MKSAFLLPLSLYRLTRKGLQLVLFVGMALLVATGLALVISSDAGSLLGLTQAQTAQILPLVILLIVFAGGIFGRRYRFAEIMSAMVLWFGLFGVALVGYTLREDILGLAGRVIGELQPGVAVVDPEAGTATFRRGIGGHFEVNAEINGATIPMLFDTGASAVVLTAADARRAGIDTSSLRYNIPVATANGTGRAAGVRLEQLEIGGISREGVRAFVAEAGALDTSLLGMTFLETLTRYSVSSDSLEMVD